MPAPWINKTTNKHGVEVRGDVPVVCCNCRFLDQNEWSEWLGRWDGEYCVLGVKLPVRKGTCKTKERMEGKG